MIFTSARLVKKEKEAGGFWQEREQKARKDERAAESCTDCLREDGEK